jgi:hypothetical protein
LYNFNYNPKSISTLDAENFFSAMGDLAPGGVRPVECRLQFFSIVPAYNPRSVSTLDIKNFFSSWRSHTRRVFFENKTQ